MTYLSIQLPTRGAIVRPLCIRHQRWFVFARAPSLVLSTDIGRLGGLVWDPPSLFAPTSDVFKRVQEPPSSRPNYHPSAGADTTAHKKCGGRGLCPPNPAPQPVSLSPPAPLHACGEDRVPPCPLSSPAAMGKCILI
uniref:Uncharacterized protein n=1 Tax=Knipowitschia caucasica TaxID=637954 RepID=A0AAV2MAC9_KNICA